MEEFYNPYDFISPVKDPKLFAGRHKELEDIRYYLELSKSKRPQYTNLALIGQRASGKTSLLNMIKSLSEERGFLAIKIDLNNEIVEDDTIFLKEIFDGIMTEGAEKGMYDGFGSKIYSGFRRLIDTFDFDVEIPLLFGTAYVGRRKGNRNAVISPHILVHDLKVLYKEARNKDISTIVLLFDECDLLANNQTLLQKIRNAFMEVDGYILVFSGTERMFPAMDEVFSPIPRFFKRIDVKNFEDFAETEECVFKPLDEEEKKKVDTESLQELHRLSNGMPYEVNLISHFMYRRFKETETEMMKITVDVLDDVLNELEMLRKGEHHEVANKIRKYGKEHLKVLISVLELPKATSDQLIEFNLLDDVESLNFEKIAIKTGEIRSIISQFKVDGIINENEDNQLYFVGDDFDLLYLKYYAISQGIKIFPFYPEKLIQSVCTKFEDVILGNFEKYKFNTRFDKKPGDESQLCTLGALIDPETAKVEPSPDGTTYTLELGRPMDWEREFYEDSPESLRYRANVKYLSDGYVSKMTFSSSEEKELALEHLSSLEDNLKLIGIELILKEEASWNNDGVKLSKLGKFEDAIECYDRAIEIDPNFFLAWGNKGLALFNLKRYEEAMECFDKNIEIKPRDFQGYENKGRALLNLKKNEEAIRCFDKAIELKPTSWISWDNKGRALFNLQKFEEAIECFNKALEDNPRNVETWNIKGMALDNLDKYKEAVESFDRAVEITPELEGVWANKGITLAKLNKLGDAIECWDRVLEINPKNKIACIVKGEMLSYLGRHDEAIECCEKALEIDPNFDGTWYYKACFESKRGSVDDAITSLKKAIEINDECIERANREKDFDSIKDDKRFTQLLNVLYSE